PHSLLRARPGGGFSAARRNGSLLCSGSGSGKPLLRERGPRRSGCDADSFRVRSVSRDRSELLDLLILVLIYLVSRIPFLYTLGFPDGDQTHTALGILDAARSGAGFHAARL